MITRKTLPRRTFFEAWARPLSGCLFWTPWRRRLRASTVPGKPPVRMAFFYVPNGVIMDAWNPDYEGKFQELPRTLKALEPYKDDMIQIGNLTHNTGRALLDGAGDHGRCCGSYLTGIQVKKSLIEIKNGISFDQIVANEIGKQTRFPSLELGMEDARQAGDCDSGYSCAYTNNLAWRERNPAAASDARSARAVRTAVRHRPADDAGGAARQAKYRRSILDFVTEDTQKLETTLGPTDRRKLDEYLSSIREVERQIERAEKDNRADRSAHG